MIELVLLPPNHKPRVSLEDTEQNDAHLPLGEVSAKMTDAPHKKQKKKKRKGEKMQHQQPEKKNDSGIDSAENNNDTEMNNAEVTPQQKRGRQQELNTPH